VLLLPDSERAGVRAAMATSSGWPGQATSTHRSTTTTDTSSSGAKPASDAPSAASSRAVIRADCVYANRALHGSGAAASRRASKHVTHCYDHEFASTHVQPIDATYGDHGAHANAGVSDHAPLAFVLKHGHSDPRAVARAPIPDLVPPATPVERTPALRSTSATTRSGKPVAYHRRHHS